MAYYYDLTLTRLEVFDEQCACVYAPGLRSDEDYDPARAYPIEATITKAVKWHGANPFTVHLEDNGSSGDGIQLEVWFESEKSMEKIFWSRLTVGGARLLRDSLNAILTLREDEKGGAE